MLKTLMPITIFSMGLAALPASAQDVSFSTGPATEINAGLIDCGKRSRPSAVGGITTEDGKKRIVPAATNFQNGPKAPDLYNGCGGQELSSLADVDIESLASSYNGGAEKFIAYIFADNYFELYVDGQLIAVDPVPFTPFNANVIKFSADRPIKLAVMGVDWEENLGLGSESGRGSAYYPGDAGIVMHIQDINGETVAITDANWRAQTFYTSPIDDRTCLTIKDGVRDSSRCSSKAASDGSSFSAAFWDIPDNWMQPDFDDSVWPLAVTYTNDTVGVNNKPAYTNFTEIFDTPGADASFIWTSNLVLDNLVLLRTTID